MRRPLTALALLTDDDIPEIVAGTSDGKVFLCNGRGVPVRSYVLRGAVTGIRPADLDGDGKAELVVSTDGGMVMALRRV